VKGDRKMKKGKVTTIKAVLCTIALLALAFVISRIASPVEAAGGNLGTARVTSVTGTDTECPTGPDGQSVQHYEVQAGGTYVVTLSGVTECSGDTIEVIVMSSSTGNQTLTASATGNTGEYQFTVTMPDNACLTFPIKYCTVGGSTSTGKFARRSDGGNFEAHLRAANFDDQCNFVSAKTDCTTPPPPQGSLQACKYYDFNANGVEDPGELMLANWPMTITPLDGGQPPVGTQITDASGCVQWTGLDPSLSPYSIAEGVPIQANWFQSNGVSQDATVASNQVTTVNFGNYCKVPSGGLTLGFWSNKNGQALITAADLTALDGLCLRNANGTNFDPTTAAQVKSFLLAANATNMANMLSAQLIAMTLNIRHGFVNGTSFDLCSGKTINQLVTDANGALCADGLTLAGNPDRPTQESAKSCIDQLNNGAPVIPATPCTYSFPQ
jgi:hypothetical protein